MHYQEQLKDMEAIPPINGFEEMILLTNQGKLWNFPIDNEQGKLENLIFFKLKLDNFLSLATKTLSDIKLITLKKNVAFGFHLSLDPKNCGFFSPDYCYAQNSTKFNSKCLDISTHKSQAFFWGMGFQFGYLGLSLGIYQISLNLEKRI